MNKTKLYQQRGAVNGEENNGEENLVARQSIKVGDYDVTLTGGVITFSKFPFEFTPQGNNGMCGFQVQVDPKPSQSASTVPVFFVIPQNKDTIIIGIPTSEGSLYPFLVNRYSTNYGEGWNNFSYPPAAIAYSQRQKPCETLEEFLLFLRQQKNQLPNRAASFNFPPGSDMAKIIFEVQKCFFPDQKASHQ